VRVREPGIRLQRRLVVAARGRGVATSLLHAVITRSENWYVAEVLELPVVTQGRTLDETVGNIREAVGLHLRGEERASLGLADHMRVAVSYETGVDA